MSIKSSLALGLGCLLLLGSACHTAGPGPVEAYRDALHAGDLRAAYALTSPNFRSQTTLEKFSDRLSTGTARDAKIDAVDAALHQLARAAPELLSSERLPADNAATVLERFLRAAERGDFQTALTLMAARWRARYTAERLAADFGRERLARERIARARAALSGGAVPHGDEVRFPIGGGAAVVLIKEDEGYRVASLE